MKYHIIVGSVADKYPKWFLMPCECYADESQIIQVVSQYWEEGYIEEAISEAEKYINNNFHNTEISNLLAAMLYLKGDGELATSIWARLIEITPTETYIQYNLGLAFFLMGQVTFARENWERVLQLTNIAEVGSKSPAWFITHVRDLALWRLERCYSNS